jgi:hypothetical protein
VIETEDPTPTPDSPPTRRDAWEAGVAHERRRRSAMPRRSISIVTAASLGGTVVGLVVGIITSTLATVAKMEAVAERVSEVKVAPLRTAIAQIQVDQTQHLQDVKEAMGPGGAMGKKAKRDAAIDAYLVESVWSICNALGPKVRCAKPSRLVTDTENDTP